MSRGNYKIVLLGDTAVGKSCLATRFVNDQFYEFQEPTIGAAFLTKNMDLDELKIKFEIWDTAGQERYRSLAPMYYRGATAAIVAYDITNPDSFEGAKGWIAELITKASSNCVITLAGNKIDLDSERQVEKSIVDDYISKNKIFHIETSAKTGTNVQELFENIARRLPKKIDTDEDHLTNLNPDYLSTYRKASCCRQ